MVSPGTTEGLRKGSTMHRKTRKIILAVAVVGALAAGGAAFTASSALSASVAGYATASISGAHANSLTYTFDTTTGDPTYGAITAVNLIFNEDLTNGAGAGDVKNDVIKSAFNGDTLTTNCAIVAPGYDGAATPSTVAGTGTHVTCDYSSAPALADTANSFAVAVSSPVATP